MNKLSKKYGRKKVFTKKDSSVPKYNNAFPSPNS